MKSLFSFIAILFISLNANAQTDALGCIDKDMRVQAEGLKQSFIKQGLTVYKDAQFTMESQQPMPIAVEMVKGRIYQMIFVGSTQALRLSVELFDGNHKKVTVKQTGKGDPNFIVYSFIPDKTDSYLIILNEKVKSRTACGSFTLLHDAPKQAEVNQNKPAAPAKK
jgi:hypothetical protein